MNLYYDVNTISIDEFRKLIASGDDSHDNQIRVTKDGKVFLSQDVVGADDLNDILFRFESFDAGNDYVGDAASKDDKHIESMFRALKANWKSSNPKSYIDDWRITNY